MIQVFSMLRRFRPQLHTGLALTLLPSLGLSIAQAVDDPAAKPKPAEKAAVDATPRFSLAECLSIAESQQPALAAHRASLAAAQSAYKGVRDLPRIPFLTRDLPTRRKQAQIGVGIAEAGVSMSQEETIYAVTRMYFSVVYARQQLEVAEHVTASLRFYQEFVGNLVKAGTSRDYSTNTVDKITVYRGLAEIRISEAERGVARASAALREAMGVGPETHFEVGLKRLPTPTHKITRDAIVEMAVARRGELVQASLAHRVVQLEVCVQAQKFLPIQPSFASVADLHASQVPEGSHDGDYRPGAVGLEMPSNFAGTLRPRGASQSL